MRNCGLASQSEPNVSLIFTSICFLCLDDTSFIEKCQGEIEMLKGTNNQNLIEAGVKEGQVFCYQTWKELTEVKTFDSYQYKSLNILNGICELIHDITSYLEGTSYTTHSVDALREELLNLLKQDIVIAEKFPSIKNQLLQSLGKKYESNSQLKGLRYQLKYCYAKLESDYDVTLTQKLALSIENQSTEQYTLISQFISRCVDLGWSVKALFWKIDTLKYEVPKDGSVDEFLSKIIKAKKQEYAIFLPFRLKISPKDGKTKEDSRNLVVMQLHSFGIDVKNRKQIIQIFPSIDSALFKETQDYIIVKTDAHDIYSAAHFAIITLARVLNIFSFFTTIDSWSINDLTLIAYNLDSPYTKSQKASDIYKTYEYLDSSSRVYRRTSEFISQNEYDHPLSQKLLSSFSYANLSRSSTALEEKFMNIWIALESLCRIDTYENIVNSIIILVPNAICLRYPYRLVRNFLEDCIRCNLTFDFSTKTIDLEADNKEKLITETIDVFRDPTLCAELETKCQVNTLLYQRYGEMLKFLTDAQVFVNKVKEYHTTVIWHLNRLYRVRNEIAHSGTLQEISIIRYTEHLYDYLATLVSEIMRFSETKNLTSLGEIFAIINDNYVEFVDLSSAKKPIDKKLVLGKLWETGIMDYL